ncbi:MAG: nuclear transport factor 2 family protein [candidate division Zixibacteria bacterium]|nr:nuclear transport factor 2 family protein [candidate division Zixibacteria bacterium]
MKHFVILSIILLLTGIIMGCYSMESKIDLDAEKAEIAEVVKNSIAWAVTKDKELLYNCFTKDEELFYFSPDDAGTIAGFKAFTNLTENFFMHEDFKAISSKVRELKIRLSKSGDMACYSARLDDYNEWKGQPANWEDVRWTGVLEKQDGKWVIVQMHFSFSAEQMANSNKDPQG